MEYLEDDNEKSIYWILFFIGVILLAVIGYFIVFTPSKEKINKSTEIKEEIDLNDYLGTWYISNEDGYRDDIELSILKIDGSTLIFSLEQEEDYNFPSINAEMDNNEGTFEADEDNLSISGNISFKNNTVNLTITSTTDEEILSTGNIVFNYKK